MFKCFPVRMVGASVWIMYVSLLGLHDICYFIDIFCIKRNSVFLALTILIRKKMPIVSGW